MSGSGSKFVPVIVIVDPTVAEGGLKPVIVGPPIRTWNARTLFDVGPAVVTEIVPVVAVAGTVTVKRVGEAEEIAALTPLKRTVFADGVDPKP
jgi:hypothetical protein